jgi:hypothetical protein
MEKYHIGRAKLFWNFIEGIVSCCVLKFQYRQIANDTDVNMSISNDLGSVARDIERVLEKIEGRYERREKKKQEQV